MKKLSNLIPEESYMIPKDVAIQFFMTGLCLCMICYSIGKASK